MKRFLVVISSLVLLLSCSTAYAIEFYGIQWGISINELIEELNNRDISVSYAEVKENVDLPKWSYKFYDLDTEDETGYRISADYHSDDNKVKIAGHPVYELDCYAHYDITDGVLNKDVDSSKFYMIKIWFDYSDKIADVVYTDLATKLTGLYGEGTEGITSISGINYYYTVWEDKDNSAVCLYHMAYTDDHFHSVHLIYGNTKIDDTLRDVRNLVIESDIKAVANDTTGL